MQRELLDRGWTVRPGKNTNNWWIDRPEHVVDLPHDFSIGLPRDPEARTGPSGGYFPGGVAEYERTVSLPRSLTGHRILLEIEGSYMNTTVRCNGQIVGHRPYGYSTFHCDLSDVARFGADNLIQVSVNNDALPNSRWYSGSGLYRHVRLFTAGSTYIPPWGVAATTADANVGHATVRVVTTVANDLEDLREVAVESILRDAAGTEVDRIRSELAVGGGGRDRAMQRLEVAGPSLWSPDEPSLYQLESVISRDGEVLDTEHTTIGIRSIHVDVQSGLLLNGQPVKLKGGCVHHDCGLLGAAAHDRAEERKVELLKACGYNAIRCAHNPPSPAFLDACDRLGMIVIDEAFDCWREGKNPHDYALYFEEWWRRDLEAMVLRDRNHPSVCIWSTGNEVVERDGRSQGARMSEELADYVRALDPTRPVTNAMNHVTEDPDAVGLTANVAGATGDQASKRDLFAEKATPVMEPLDVAGYNYLDYRYESDGSLFPGRVICGTETFPRAIYDGWKLVEKLPHVIGDFVWTAIDYLGEAGLGRLVYDGKPRFLGDYPWHQAHCGDIDICGFRRPQSYYRDCVWGRDNAPFIAVYPPEHHGADPWISWWGWPDVASSWSWPGWEGKPVTIDIYSSADEVELFQDRRSLGRQPAGDAQRHVATFETVYEPGELVAVGYRDGSEAGRSVLVTAGPPVALRLTPDRSTLDRGFGDLAFVTVELVDAAGNVAHAADDAVHCEVAGAGSLLAFGTGDPVSTESYTGPERHLYNGRAMVVVRAADAPGPIRLTVSVVDRGGTGRIEPGQVELAVTMGE